MHGTVGVAPAGGEARSSLVPDAHGGNMDTPEMRAGTTCYLGVNVDGALFSLGDGHCRQGEGETCGVAVEAAMDTVLVVELIKGRLTPWPRLENDEHIMSTGSARPLEDAFRIAHGDLVHWLAEEHGLDALDAYQLVSQIAESPVANVCDPNYTFVAKAPKRHLPSGDVYASTTGGPSPGYRRRTPIPGRARARVSRDHRASFGAGVSAYHPKVGVARRPADGCKDGSTTAGGRVPAPDSVVLAPRGERGEGMAERADDKAMISEKVAPVLVARTLGPFDLVVIFVAIVLFINNSAGVQFAGPSVFIFWIVAFATFLVTGAFVTAQLGRMFPEEGSLYVWTHKVLGPFWGFFAGFVAWWPGPISLVFIGILLANFIQQFAVLANPDCARASSPRTGRSASSSWL